MEQFEVGSAGIIGNVLNTAYIVVTTVYSFLFFGEVMKPLALAGAALVGGAILIVTGVKVLRKIYEEEQQEGDTEKRRTAKDKAKGRDLTNDDDDDADNDEEVYDDEEDLTANESNALLAKRQGKR